MKMIDSEALVGLPREVLALIRDGVYSLYTLPSSTGYLLVTNRGEFYFLTADGHPQAAPGLTTLDDVDLDQAVSFSDAPSSSGMQVNWA